MRNDSLETLLLRHYGSSAPTPAKLEEKLCAAVHEEAEETRMRQQRVAAWQERRVSRRRMLQLVTLSGAGLSAVALGLNALQDQRRPAYAV